MQTKVTSSNSEHAIAFCVTSRNRLWQLSQTLKLNLLKLKDDQMISLVDYGSSDGLSDWIWNNFEPFIKNKKLLFFEVLNKVYWSCPRAKNLSHRLANAKYLFNLDADNRIDDHDIELITQAANLNRVIHQFSGHWPDGSYGRIGLSKELFEKIGGYDESLLAMGGQDVDLLRRIFALKINIFKLPPPSITAVQNSKEDKMSSILSSQSDPEKSYNEHNNLNLRFSKVRLNYEGPIRLGGFSTFDGYLNGNRVLIDGFNNITHL